MKISERLTSIAAMSETLKTLTALSLVLSFLISTIALSLLIWFSCAFDAMRLRKVCQITPCKNTTAERGVSHTGYHFTNKRDPRMKSTYHTINHQDLKLHWRVSKRESHCWYPFKKKDQQNGENCVSKCSNIQRSHR